MKQRYNLTLDTAIVKQADEMADERNMSRSTLIGIALKIYIKSNDCNVNQLVKDELKGQVKIC